MKFIKPFVVLNIYVNFEKNLKKHRMTLEKTFCFDVDTPHGTGTLQMVYETELGIVMGKVFFPIEKIFINYRMSDIDEKFNISFIPFKMGLKRRPNHIFA
jgi:hypothetical protein